MGATNLFGAARNDFAVLKKLCDPTDYLIMPSDPIIIIVSALAFFALFR